MITVQHKSSQNLIALFPILLTAIILITIIGYFDEGHYRIYGSFTEYILQGGTPPLSDYIMWCLIFGVIQLGIFNLLSSATNWQRSLAERVILSAISLGGIVLILLVLLFTLA